MKLKVDDIQFNILLNKSDLKQDKIPIIFLHGFTGCANDWQFIFNKLPQKYLPIAIDLIGHGETDAPEDQKYYSCSSIVHQIDLIIEQLEIKKFIITGYSMGGRAVLSYCSKNPHKIIGAILESTTAGIDDIRLKIERVELDLLFADKIKSEGVRSFVDYWFDTPLFESLKKLPQFKQIKNERNKNNPIGLANTLAGFSTGLMTSCWDKLHTLNFPILLFSGELDEKYTGLGKKMQSIFPNAKHQIVSQCGHNVHLEKPELFIRFANDFLNSLERTL